MGLENGEASSTERRKSSKPMMEKRRRARINESLGELKHLILEAMKKDTSCYSKLEKADILEMTVGYLRSLKTQQASAGRDSTPTYMAHYRAGFNECAKEVSRYLSATSDLDVQIKSTMLSHLSAQCRPLHKPTKDIQLEPVPLAPRYAFHPHSIPATPRNPPPTLLTLPSGVPNRITTSTQYDIVPRQLANGSIAAVLVPNQGTAPSMPRILPAYNKPPIVDYQSIPGLSSPTTRHDPVWRPWY